MEKITVCIVEDVSDIREALIQIIGLSDSCKVVGAFSNGETAMQQIPEIRPQVVLMDIGLGTTSGIELVRELKQRFPEMLFMMCTIYEEDEKIFEALRAGANGYILKKSSPSKLLEAITELVQGGAPMSSQIARKVVNTFKNLPVAPETGAANNSDEEVQGLTKREIEIVECLAQGKIYKEIAGELKISAETVRKHVYHIYEKLHVSNRMEAVNKYLGR